MKVIGLGHYSRTGKDSFANYLLEWFSNHVPSMRAGKMSFAWKLKQVCHELYAWAGLREPEFYETPEGAPLREVVLPAIGKTPVQIWVDFGTPAVRQQVYDRTWIDYLLKSEHDLDVVIIPDVRFPNEVAAVREIGGTLIKVVRPGYGPRKTVADRALVGFTGWDFVIGGSGAMSELAAWAQSFGHWLAGGVEPYQADADREAACKVEVIEPWEPEKLPASGFTVTFDETTARAFLEMEDACFSEGIGPQPVLTILDQIRATFPTLAGEYSYLYP